MSRRNEECPRSFNCVSNPGYVVYSIYGYIDYVTGIGIPIPDSNPGYVVYSIYEP